MKRTLACSLVFTAWQTGCTDPGATVGVTALPLLDAEPSNTASVVAVHTEQDAAEQLCTGTLLLPNLVLTARHCLVVNRTALESGNCKGAIVTKPDAKTLITVIAGPDIDLAFDAQTYAVGEAWLPQDKGQLCGQDLALLYLANPIDARPLSLTQSLPNLDSAFTAYGYGLADGDYGKQRITSEAALACFGDGCEDVRIESNELLAQSGVCDGDSGGPALNGKGQVFAVASRSARDCSETAYVTFANHFEWLAVATREAAKNGDFDVPKWAVVPAETQQPDASNPTPTEEPTLHVTGGCTMAPSSRPHSSWGLLGLGFALVGFGQRRRR